MSLLKDLSALPLELEPATIWGSQRACRHVGASAEHPEWTIRSSVSAPSPPSAGS
jgi:hypothetical protein